MTSVSLEVKSWMAVPLIGIAFLNLFTMFEILGRAEKRFDVKKLRLIHRSLGWVGFVLMLIIGYVCLLIVRHSGGAMTPRGAVHALTAVILLGLLTVKIIIVRSYRKLFSYVPIIGIMVFIFLTTTLTLSAGTYLFSHANYKEHTSLATVSESIKTEGKRIFEANCSGCHYTDKTKTRIGPGLKGLSSRKKLPVSGRAVTPENLRLQLEKPFDNMPSFDNLSDTEKEALIEFLLSL